MKTTVEISDALLRDVRKLAMRDGVTLRTLVERGLRRVVAESRIKKPPFKLARASVKGKGLHPDLSGASWEKIRDMIYEGRGS